MQRQQLPIAMTSGVLTAPLTLEYLRNAAGDLMETAKSQLRTEKVDVTPTAVLYQEKASYELQFRFTTQAEKDAFYDLVARMGAEMGAVAIVSVADALMRLDPSVQAPQDTLMVNVVSARHFPGGYMLLTPYTRDGNTVSFEPTQEVEGNENCAVGTPYLSKLKSSVS